MHLDFIYLNHIRVSGSSGSAVVTRLQCWHTHMHARTHTHTHTHTHFSENHFRNQEHPQQAYGWLWVYIWFKKTMLSLKTLWGLQFGSTQGPLSIILLWCAFVLVYAMCSSRLAHPPNQVFLNWFTDDQEEENESGLFLLLVCSCTNTLQFGFFLIAKKI